MATIVLADDHALMRAGLRRILEAHGHFVLGEVSDGLQVANTVKELRPELLMLDLGMPGLHGLDALRDVRRRARAVRVLIVSAYNRDEFVVAALRMGAAGYLLKGADCDELLKAVGAVAGGGFYVSPQVAGPAGRYAEGLERDTYQSLTKRQKQVFHLMAEGMSRQHIAERLFISIRTVEDHRLRIMRKLGLETQTDVVLFALRRGILALDDAAGAPRLEG